MTSAPVKPKGPSALTIILTIAAIMAVLIMVLVRVPTKGIAMSPSSTAKDGTRAVAEILRDNGIAVEEITTLEAVTLAGPETTLVIHSHMDDDARKALIDSRATIVLITGVELEEWGFIGTVHRKHDISLRAECEDPDAQEAYRISPIRWLYKPEVPGGHGCFPGAEGYAWFQHPDHPQISYLPSSAILTNEYLSREGNAAFALRKLGSQPQVYWVSTDDSRVNPYSQTGAWSGLPDWFFPLMGGLTLTLGWWVLYRSRRFGKLVAEPLPVVVPASEVNEGRSILYQRGKNYGHAARALRAAAISRLAKGRGISDDARPEIVVDTLARASGYPPAVIADLLYERPVTGDSDLVTLATELDRFERDINVQ